MAITTCQKVTLISCSVLCVSLFLPGMLLPRRRKEKGQPEVGPGFYSSVKHQLPVPDDPDQWDVDSSPSLSHTVEAMAKVMSIQRGKKYNLMAQVIPIYSFGILLYILYIIHKLTNKSKINKPGLYTTVKMTSMRNTATTDYELARLQQQLLQAEMMMERIVSERSNCSSRKRKNKTSASKKEEKLLRQLRQISLLMQEGRLEGASPEMEAEEVPYSADWEGYPEETYPQYDDHRGNRREFRTFRPEDAPSQPTAEALAERMEQEEEEIVARKLSIVHEEEEDEVDKEEEEEVNGEEEEDEETEVEESVEEEEEAEQKQLLPPIRPTVNRKQERVGLEVSTELQHHSGRKKQISFSDRKHVFHYPKEETFEEEEDEKEEETEEEETEVEDEDEEAGAEDDPLMEAESLQFSCEGSSNPYEGEEEECMLLALEEDEDQLHVDLPKEVEQSGLRMRNRRET
nr:protein RIC-3 [Nothobranchius furzeri]